MFCVYLSRVCLTAEIITFIVHVSANNIAQLTSQNEKTDIYISSSELVAQKTIIKLFVSFRYLSAHTTHTHIHTRTHARTHSVTHASKQASKQERARRMNQAMKKYNAERKNKT